MDANIVIAAFLRDSTVRRILALSLLEFAVPEFLSEELDRHMPELAARAGISRQTAGELRRRIEGYLLVIPREAIRPHLRRAEETMDFIDRRDAPYLASALAVPCDGLWSDDPHLKRQNLVPCWTTRELLEELRAEGLKL